MLSWDHGQDLDNPVRKEELNLMYAICQDSIAFQTVTLISL